MTLPNPRSSWTASQIAVANDCSVAVLYASAYGNTAALAQAISRGITKAGVGVETLNLENATLEEVSAAVARCAGFVIGSPTLGGHMPTQVRVCARDGCRVSWCVPGLKRVLPTALASQPRSAFDVAAARMLPVFSSYGA